MQVHPLVTQLRFARSEFIRCIDGITPQEAVQRIEPMNSIGWMIGHLANQEQFLWVRAGQGNVIAPDLNDQYGFGKPASTPDMNEIWAIWRAIIYAADKFLDQLKDEGLSEHLELNGKPLREDTGTALLRNIYHYWFHTGEAHAVRQMLGHQDLPQFVGRMSSVRYE